MFPHAYISRRLARGAVLLALASAVLTIAPAPADEPTSAEEHEGRAPTEQELEPAVEAAFRDESYAPGARASLVVFNRGRRITLQILHVGPERVKTRGNNEMRGIPVTQRRQIGSSHGHRVVTVQIGPWPSGLYTARLRAADGRVGFAPFVVRPRRLGEHRVAVVLPTLTWQAYNLHDDDGDGRGDTWYASWKVRTARLARPYLNRGVPYHFRRYDLPFLRWLARTRRGADVLSDADLEAAPDPATLAAAYDLIVFPGHHEYVTRREYDLVEGYRDLGGNLAFLSANNFFWEVVRRGRTIEKTKQWRDLGRPEAALIGVQYRGNDNGRNRGAWIVRDAVSELFAGMGLRRGSGFGRGGIEIDHTAPESPRGTRVLAEIPNLFGPGFTGQMTYYETSAGSKVFAAGAFTLAGSIWEAPVRRLVANLWTALTADEV
jgi:hypothetical protein